ncbi:hypothetical protein KQX54_010028 [Cotesia glomerata]|uniref:Uncharacterized protein n=1 Tax=Cotesia glomerata TaxID=32391 RepID=A0AAV7IE40_COTGL|nr:hypothetical protein KQX54_010028 [Cotesia glomerata]
MGYAGRTLTNTGIRDIEEDHRCTETEIGLQKGDIRKIVVVCVCVCINLKSKTEDFLAVISRQNILHCAQK